MSTINPEKARRALEMALPLIERERDLIIDCESIDGDIRTMTESAQADVAQFNATIAFIKEALGEESKGQESKA